MEFKTKTFAFVCERCGGTNIEQAMWVDLLVLLQDAALGRFEEEPERKEAQDD